MVALGPMELLLVLLMSAAGQPTDMASLLSPEHYFKARGIEISVDAMVELASKEPVDGKTQLAQLLALRVLGEEGQFKKSAAYETQRRVIEEIARGRKAQDNLGFAKEQAQRTLALLDGIRLPPAARLGPRADGLAWFPASATLVGGIESRPALVPGPVKSPVPELLRKMPPEITKEFYKVAESLGNFQIQRLTGAFVDEGSDKGRNFIRVTGRINHAWLRELLKTTGLETKERKDPQGTAITLFTRGQALALVGDHDLLIAGFTQPGKDQDVLEQALALREKGEANAATGGLKANLAKIPAQAVAYLTGEFPEDFRRDVGRGLGAFPKEVSAHLTRTANGFDLIFQGGMDNEDQAKTFVKTAAKLRTDGLEALKQAPEVPFPGVNLGEIRNVLNSLQLEAKGSAVSVRMLLSDSAVNTVPLFLLGYAAVGEVAPPARKKGN